MGNCLTTSAADETALTAKLLVARKSAEPVDETVPEDGEIVPRIESRWRFRDGKFQNARGLWLYYCTYFPDRKTTLRGVVVFLHGLGEYARRFTHVFDVLCASGFGVVAYDLVSHGRSDDDERGQRAHARKFQHFVDDTNVFVTFAKQSLFPEMLGAATPVGEAPPLIFMGMSYGTLVGLHTVLSEQHAFAAMVLAAPAVSVEWTSTLKFQAACLRPLGTLLPRLRITPGVNYDFLSRDPQFVFNYMADPMVPKQKITTGMATATLGAMEKIQHDARVADAATPFCQLPLLVVQGSEDKITSVPLAEEFFGRVGSRDKEFKKFDGLYHCIFNEPERDVVLDHITDWLTQRFPSPTAN